MWLGRNILPLPKLWPSREEVCAGRATTGINILVSTILSPPTLQSASTSKSQGSPSPYRLASQDTEWGRKRWRVYLRSKTDKWHKYQARDVNKFLEDEKWMKELLELCELNTRSYVVRRKLTSPEHLGNAQNLEAPGITKGRNSRYHWKKKDCLKIF